MQALKNLSASASSLQASIEQSPTQVLHPDTCKHHGKKNNVNCDHTNTTVHLIRATLSATINLIRITDTQ